MLFHQPGGERANDIKRLSTYGLMGNLKVVIHDEVEGRFRVAAMKRYGYGKGALSRAAEEALLRWLSDMENIEHPLAEVEDPVAAIEGMLKHVSKSSVELQHEAARIRAEKALKYATHRRKRLS